MWFGYILNLLFHLIHYLLHSLFFLHYINSHFNFNMFIFFLLLWLWHIFCRKF